jgi:ATP-dependent DNA helicase DinG
MITPLNTFAEAEQRLAESLPNYESRTQQQAFAQAVERSLDTGRHLLAQAGCGCGKSLGYLIPAILSGKRIVVATATKALQDQVAEKDLPFLQEHLGVDFTFAVLKGRANYVCQARLLDLEPGSVDTDTVSEIQRLIAEDPDFDGLREQLPDIADREWSKLTVSGDACPGKKNCPFGQQCFAERAKTRAKEADVVVVNHALYFTDLLIRTKTAGAVSLIGAHDVVIFDEAHEAADYATNAFGITITEATFASLGAEARNFGASYTGGSRVDSATGHLAGAGSELFGALPEGRISPAYVVENQDYFLEVLEAVRKVRSAVGALTILDGDTKAATRKKIITRRADTLIDKITSIILDDASTTVRWVEVEKGGRRRGGGNFPDRKLLKALPINVGDAYLRDLLFDAPPVTLEDGEVVTAPLAILASATMKTGGNFEFLAKSLGIDTYDSVDVGTPFDFAKQAVLYVPSHLPEPVARNRDAWRNMAQAEIRDLVRASDGRALLLFTSKADMQSAPLGAVRHEVVLHRCRHPGRLTQPGGREQDAVPGADRAAERGALRPHQAQRWERLRRVHDPVDGATAPAGVRSPHPAPQRHGRGRRLGPPDDDEGLRAWHRALAA